MRKTHKELLNEIMEQVREKAERKKEFRERIAQIEEKKNKGIKTVLKEPLVTGYLETKKEDVYVDQYGVKHVYVDKKNMVKRRNIPVKRVLYGVSYTLTPEKTESKENESITMKKSNEEDVEKVSVVKKTANNSNVKTNVGSKNKSKRKKIDE